MHIDIWTSGENGNVEGEIVFILKSGENKQGFKRTWTVVNTPSHDLMAQKIECLKGLLEVRLKELKIYLYKQLEQGVINTGTELIPLESDWEII